MQGCLYCEHHPNISELLLKVHQGSFSKVKCIYQPVLGQGQRTLLQY